MREAKLIWKRMSDPRDMDVRISHDGQWPLGVPCTHCSSFVHIDRFVCVCVFVFWFVCLCFAVGYVKVWQVRQPKVTGFDCLLIDEAQDLTPGECALEPVLHMCEDTCTCRGVSAQWVVVTQPRQGGQDTVYIPYGSSSGGPKSNVVHVLQCPLYPEAPLQSPVATLPHAHYVRN